MTPMFAGKQIRFAALFACVLGAVVVFHVVHSDSEELELESEIANAKLQLAKWLWSTNIFMLISVVFAG